MSAAGDRVNQIFEELFHPIEGEEDYDLYPTQVEGTKWLIPTPRCIYGVDLAQLAPLADELMDLLYHHPREQHEIDANTLFAIGLAHGVMDRLGLWKIP